MHESLSARLRRLIGNLEPGRAVWLELGPHSKEGFRGAAYHAARAVGARVTVRRTGKGYWVRRLGVEQGAAGGEVA